MKSQPMLPLRDMSKSVPIEHQGLASMSMAHITSIEHGDVLAWAVARDHMDGPGAVQNLPCLSLAVVRWRVAPPITSFFFIFIWGRVAMEEREQI